MSAFYTLPRAGAGLAQYAGAGAWEGGGRWGAGLSRIPAPTAQRRARDVRRETHPHPTLPLKGRAFERGDLLTNPPLQGEGMGGDGFAPTIPVSSTSENPASNATTAFSTDAPSHAQ